MKDTITEFTFCHWFQKSAERKHQFSYDGLKALFAYYEQFEADTGQEIEFDPIAICCDWTEYEDLDDYNEQNDTDYDFETLCGDTQVIDVDKEKIIVMNF